MSANAFTPTRGSIPWGLLGMLGLIVAAESWLECHHLDFTRFYIHDWREAARAAGAQARECRVLCFGDSLVKFGVVPATLEARLRTSAYNLAVCDGQAASSYYLLRRALAAGARPAAVVVDFVPHLLATDPRHNLRQWPELLDWPELVDLGAATRHAGFFAALVLGKVLPSVKDRYEIRGSVASALRGRSASRREEVPGYVSRWRLDRGAQLEPPRPSYQGEVDVENPAYFPRVWRCHPTNARYIERILELAGEHGIAVVWLIPPVTPRFQARRDALGLEASYSRFVSSLTRRHPNLAVVDARDVGFDHSLFIDPLHLSEPGARALSARVAAALGPILNRHGPSRRSGTEPGSVASVFPVDRRIGPALIETQGRTALGIVPLVNQDTGEGR
jgi:hypothetical protein